MLASCLVAIACSKSLGKPQVFYPLRVRKTIMELSPSRYFKDVGVLWMIFTNCKRCILAKFISSG